MEMPTVGQRCAHLECKRLDFLPFTCSHCQQVFCREHFVPDCHSCAHFVDRVVTNVEEIVPSVQFRCTFPQCPVRDPLEMPCVACGQHFCLAHRHHGCVDVPYEDRGEEREKWDVPRRRFEAAKAEADRQVGENLSRAINKPGVNKTAIKLQLMRLKGKAIGSKSVPPEDRLHFLVHAPLSLGRKARAVFVGRHWTAGRAIDATSELCDVANRNNVAGAPKLRLFRHSDGIVLTQEMDRKLDDLLKEGSLVDGESLVLEYLTDGSTDRLEDADRYRDSSTDNLVQRTYKEGRK